MCKMDPDSYNFFAFTPRGQISSIISATLSSISSLFVMTFILRSQHKLRSAYHRIMFFMSFWDFVTSLAIAMSTLPMPPEVHDVYDFVGQTRGSIAMCEAQAFLIMIGSAFTIFSNAVLNLYYVCTIRYNMTEEKFNKIFLPTFLAIAAAIIIPSAGYYLSRDFLNPVPFYPYCLVGPYPCDCNTNEEVQCIRGSMPSATEQKFENCMAVFIGLGLITILISLVLVISAVFKTEMAVRNNAVRRDEDGNDGDGDGDSDGDGDGDGDGNEQGGAVSDSFSMAGFKETRTTFRQALMYIFAFILTWGWVIILFIIPGTMTSTYVMDQFKLFFQPLQGFFNALIFIYSKVLILRRANSIRGHLSYRQALVWIIFSPKTVPERLISRIDILSEMEGNRNPGDISRNNEERYQARGVVHISTNENNNNNQSSLVSDGRAPAADGDLPSSIVSALESIETPAIEMTFSDILNSDDESSPRNTSNLEQSGNDDLTEKGLHSSFMPSSSTRNRSAMMEFHKIGDDDGSDEVLSSIKDDDSALISLRG